MKSALSKAIGTEVPWAEVGRVAAESLAFPCSVFFIPWCLCGNRGWKLGAPHLLLQVIPQGFE